MKKALPILIIAAAGIAFLIWRKYNAAANAGMIGYGYATTPTQLQTLNRLAAARDAAQ